MNSIILPTVLASVSAGTAIGLSFGALVLGALIGIIIYFFLSKKKLNSANVNANKIIQKAIEDAKGLHKKAVSETNAEVAKQLKDLSRQKEEVEKDIKEKKSEALKVEERITQREEKLVQKEEALDKKHEEIDKKKENLKTKQEEIEVMKEQIGHSHAKMLAELEKVSKLTKEEARKELIKEIVDSAKIDAAKLVREIEANAKEDGEKKAREIISTAIQRCTVDHTAEITVSTVVIPNEDMKGRIIGREGRNVRALENATGVDFIIDDTPDTVVLSGFDPVRREIARVSLEKLITDGRIHPARIEEVVEKSKREIEHQVKEAGEAAMFEAGVFGLNPELIKILGRLKYRTSYGQNVLRHSLEVAHLAGLMAAELGADVSIAKRGGLLHDIGKTASHEVEGTHVTIGVDIAKKFNESKDVLHCIEAHHGDVEATTVEAILVQCADSISGSKPGARRESLENYVKRLEKLESIANSFEGVEKSYAIQAGREVRIIVKPEQVDDERTILLAKDIAKQIESDMQYPGQVKVSVVRELRSVEYAK
ncbi:MAG: ribonuclease Y [Firmicutes bacterium]|nr:ribonuclease Y [Bacillota bacterium]